ncbi:arabinose efflux permease family protein [Chamaesiphon minutus PCC 6605]|uniref:Arabinose efflux permease family protein n=2 Tax=Chamaesiphon TaxID=217161 RepID=K9UH62_CHAP6|nr:tetracycline resistance MFS efflux pump [Chamaesiphon minutus]AFY93988.1 arabinose efflux permease family protein [Chamaesiphon minutus PCC 6605]
MNRSFWIIAIINFINALSFTILIPTIYQYGREFNLSDKETSLLFAIFSIAQFFATPIIGKLSDRFGRRPLLIISLVGTVIGNFMAGTATNAPVLFFARFLDGVTGGNVSVAQAVIADVTTPENRAKGYGIFGASLGLGFVMGPVLSLVAQQRSLGTAFLVSSGIAAFALILTILFLPETLPERTNNNTNIFDLGLRDLIRGLTFPRIGILFIINLCVGTTFTLFTFAFQPYYLKVLHQDNRSLTLLFFAIGVVGVVVQLQGVKILTRYISFVKILFLGLFFRSLSFVLMPIVPDIYFFLAISTIFAIFNSVVQPMISTLISLNTTPEEQGKMSGLNASYLSAANGIGPVIAGLMVDQNNPTTYGYPLYLAGIFTFIVLFFAVRNRRKFTPKQTQPTT